MMVAAMLQKLVNCLLALVLAAVFAGETASAGRPCHQQPAMAEAAADAHHATPCHEMAEPDAAPSPEEAGKQLCECVALLKASMAGAPKLTSARIEPWSYAQPGAVALASLDLVPDGPPPKG